MNIAGLVAPTLLDLASPGSLTHGLLDKMTEGVSPARAEDIIFYTNPALNRMFGYGPGELRSQHALVQNAYAQGEYSGHQRRHRGD